MSDNRRTATRHAISIAAVLTVNQAATDCTISNLSLGGVQLAGTAKLGLGQRVEIAFRVPTIEDAISVGATVRWADATGIGLQFDGLRARDVWALNEYFKQLSA